MRKIITSAQVREADQYTIGHEPVAAIDLMERAALAFAGVFCELVPDRHTPILVCCGTGNNGGDGLAIARILFERGYGDIRVLIVRFSGSESPDFSRNLTRLRNNSAIPVKEISRADEIGATNEKVLVDALLGSGLNKPLQGEWQSLVEKLKGACNLVIAVDIPTGLRADGKMPAGETALNADVAISFQRPKLSFFFPESAPYIRRFYEVPIGLDETFIQSLPSDFYVVEPVDVRAVYRQRQPFSHKGTYGHALLIAGGEGTIGAGVLCSGASLYAGSGLTSTYLSDKDATALNQRYPEVMTISGQDLVPNWERYSAVALGPGLGSQSPLLKELFGDKKKLSSKPMLLDADALNYLAVNKEVLDQLQHGSILTPHMKEFDRLFGDHENWWGRVQTARTEAMKRNLVIVLKNQYTFIALADGRILINTTGNPAMASGGMGDVLTGIIISFLAQGYPPEQAAMLGCYLHGRAGDRLYHKGMAVVPASKLIEELPFAIRELE